MAVNAFLAKVPPNTDPQLHLFDFHAKVADIKAKYLKDKKSATAIASPAPSPPAEIAALSTLGNVTTGKRSSSATELNEAKVIAFLANEPQITDPQFNYPPREWK